MTLIEHLAQVGTWIGYWVAGCFVLSGIYLLWRCLIVWVHENFVDWMVALGRARIIRTDLPMRSTAGAELEGSAGKPSAAFRPGRSQQLPPGGHGQVLDFERRRVDAIDSAWMRLQLDGLVLSPLDAEGKRKERQS